MTGDAVAPEGKVVRKDVLGGSVTAQEKALAKAAAERAGYPNLSTFVRKTVLKRARNIMADKRAADRSGEGSRAA